MKAERPTEASLWGTWTTGFWYEIDLYSSRLLNELPMLQSSLCTSRITRAFQATLAVKKSPVSTGDVRDVGSIPGWGRSPGGGHGNPLQYSCLENPHGQRSLAGCSPWGRKELDMTEVTEHACKIAFNKPYLHWRAWSIFSNKPRNEGLDCDEHGGERNLRDMQ